MKLRATRVTGRKAERGKGAPLRSANPKKAAGGRGGLSAEVSTRPLVSERGGSGCQKRHVSRVVSLFRTLRGSFGLGASAIKKEKKHGLAATRGLGSPVSCVSSP